MPLNSRLPGFVYEIFVPISTNIRRLVSCLMRFVFPVLIFQIVTWLTFALCANSRGEQSLIMDFIGTALSSGELR